MPEFLEAVADGSLDLPVPGDGQTDRRFDALWQLARHDVALARLVEAHTDARAILAEAGHDTPAGASFGVWAAEGPGSTIDAEVCAERVRLIGSKRWCSGAGIVSHALVTAHDELLVLLELDQPGVTVVDDGWVAPAFASTNTARIDVDVVIGPECIVGGPGFYLDRPGFWYGAVGVAACWAGGAEGLVDLLDANGRDDPHTRVAKAAARAEVWNLRCVLSNGAALIDSHELDHDAEKRASLALTVRHLTDVAVAEIVRLVTRALGPGPMAHDADVARRISELQLYVRQFHAERDLDSLGALPRPPDPWPAPVRTG